MKKISFIVLMLTATFLSFQGQAQPGFCTGQGPGQGAGQGKDSYIPDLSEEQRQKIDDSRTAMLAVITPLKNQIAVKHAELTVIESGKTPDLNVIYAKIDEIGKLQNEIAKTRAKHEQDVRSILTDEQRVYFDARHAMKGRGGNGQGCCAPGKGPGGGMHQGKKM